jgi:F-type H+-transporting ATPase subunit b
MIDFEGRRVGTALVVVSAAISLVILCGMAFASGGGEQGGAHDSGKLLDLLYRGICFSLLVIILFVVIRKVGLKEYLSARREEIRKRFNDLKSEREESEKRYLELEKRLKEFEKKKKEMIEQFKAEGVVEKEKIIAEARERAAQILAQADLTIGREIQAARERVMHEVLNAAAQNAQEIISKEIKDSDQDQLVNEFIEKVEKLH